MSHFSSRKLKDNNSSCILLYLTLDKQWTLWRTFMRCSPKNTNLIDKNHKIVRNWMISLMKMGRKDFGARIHFNSTWFLINPYLYLFFKKISKVYFRCIIFLEQILFIKNIELLYTLFFKNINHIRENKIFELKLKLFLLSQSSNFFFYISLKST